jgi:malonyl CoA-acyl carrier protein transacylase
MNFRQNLDTTNRLLNDPGITAMGGYSLGVVSCLAEQEGVVAPDVLLEAAAQCQTIAAAVELYRSCVELRRGKAST